MFKKIFFFLYFLIIKMFNFASTKLNNLVLGNTDYSKLQTQNAVPKGYVDQQISLSKTYTDNKISEIIGNAPSTLDTLKEIADALGNDQNLSSTLVQKITQNDNLILNEIERAKEVESSLLLDLNSEIERAKIAEQNLQNIISDETTRSKTTENVLLNLINTEVQTRINDKTLINSNIDNEIARAIAAEQNITTLLQSESKRSQDAEKELNDKIVNESNNNKTVITV